MSSLYLRCLCVCLCIVLFLINYTILLSFFILYFLSATLCLFMSQVYVYYLSIPLSFCQCFFLCIFIFCYPLCLSLLCLPLYSSLLSVSITVYLAVQYMYVLSSMYALTLTTQNPPRSSKGHFFWEKSALFETGTFTFKWGKITPWQEVQAISAKYERSTKMHGAFWR